MERLVRNRTHAVMLVGITAGTVAVGHYSPFAWSVLESVNDPYRGAHPLALSAICTGGTLRSLVPRTDWPWSDGNDRSERP